MSEIEVIPRILVLDKEAVAKDQDEYVGMEIDASEAINGLIESFGKVLIVDLNGVQNNRPKLDFVLLFEKKPIWVDGGARNANGAIDLFIAGAEKVVMKTGTLLSLDELRQAHELSDQLIFQIDLVDGKHIAGVREFEERNPEDLLKDVARIGVRSCLYVDEGGNIPSPSILRGLPEDFEFYVGMLHQSDSARFENSRVKGIIVDAQELI